jgi:AcrR family transcriptional regulator
MTTAPGRPRDRRIDRAVLDATAELLVEVGYAELTIAAVAERARTTKPAIYRRWTGKAQLVHEAAFPSDADRVQVPATGSLESDLRAMVRACVEVFAHPVARAAIPGLVAEFAADPTLHAALVGRLAAGPLGVAHDRLAAAAVSGEARADLDPGTVIEAMAGAALLALLFRGDADLDDAWTDRTTTLLLRGIAP